MMAYGHGLNRKAMLILCDSKIISMTCALNSMGISRQSQSSAILQIGSGTFTLQALNQTLEASRVSFIPPLSTHIAMNSLMNHTKSNGTVTVMLYHAEYASVHLHPS